MGSKWLHPMFNESPSADRDRTVQPIPGDRRDRQKPGLWILVQLFLDELGIIVFDRRAIYERQDVRST